MSRNKSKASEKHSISLCKYFYFFNFQKLFQNAEKLYQRLHLRKEVCQVYFAIKNKKQDLQQAKTHSYSLAINRQI